MMRFRPNPKLLTFCLAVAVIAAAVADPLVEFASNAGWFGHGLFTDRSNADVLPALPAGAVVLALFILRRARAILDGCALPRRCWTLLPAIFVVQLVVLFVMETCEQIVLCGGVLGPAVWLGGPIAASLAMHALSCVAFTWIFARCARGLAKTTLRVLHMIRAIATFAIAPGTIVRLQTVDCSPCKNVPLLCRIGERAPPWMLA
jgi:hypothetical protein